MQPSNRAGDPSELARVIGAQLMARSECLALAESCTGGWVAKMVTDIAGSSAWFERGLVTYSNAAKQDLLGVTATILETEGAVSQGCVNAMAEGLIARSQAHWGIAITGIAGPGGGSVDKPVGTVWIGWVRRGASVKSQCYHFQGDREAVRLQSVQAAFEGLLSCFDNVA